jgi:hypothetical protein
MLGPWDARQPSGLVCKLEVTAGKALTRGGVRPSVRLPSLFRMVQSVEPVSMVVQSVMPVSMGAVGGECGDQAQFPPEKQTGAVAVPWLGRLAVRAFPRGLTPRYLD